MIRRFFIFAAVLFLSTATLLNSEAHSYKKGKIFIGHVWAKPSEDGKIQVYGPLINNGTKDDSLISASYADAESVSFIKKGQNGEVTKLDSLELRHGRHLSLASWGTYIQIKGLNKPLNYGDSFPLTLTFSEVGKITVNVEVEKGPGHTRH